MMDDKYLIGDIPVSKEVSDMFMDYVNKAIDLEKQLATKDKESKRLKQVLDDIRSLSYLGLALKDKDKESALLNKIYTLTCDFVPCTEKTGDNKIKRLKHVVNVLVKALKLAVELEKNGLISYEKYGFTCNDDILKKYEAALKTAKQKGR